MSILPCPVGDRRENSDPAQLTPTWSYLTSLLLPEWSDVGAWIQLLQEAHRYAVRHGRPNSAAIVEVKTLAA